MIRMARERNKLTITATQMMESMIQQPGADARRGVRRRQRRARRHRRGDAVGRDRGRQVSGRDGRGDERRSASRPRNPTNVELDRDFLNRAFTRIDQSIAMAALFTAFHLKVKAIASLTQSGSTALWMSRHNCGCPDLRADARSRVAAQDGALPQRAARSILEQSAERDAVLHAAEDLLLTTGQVQHGDLIVLTIGEPMGKSGGTNTMKIVRVGEHRA